MLGFIQFGLGVGVGVDKEHKHAQRVRTKIMVHLFQYLTLSQRVQTSCIHIIKGYYMSLCVIWADISPI